MGTLTANDAHTSEGDDINNLQEMVGASTTDIGGGQFQYRAAYKSRLTSKNFGWHSLGVLGSGANTGNQSVAHGINNKGVIVGWSYIKVNNVNTSHAFVLSNRGDAGSQPLMDLNDQTWVDIGGGQWATAASQGWVLYSAKKMNENNWIVGYGYKGNAPNEPFLLKPLTSPPQ
jgi:hypothetical protein